MHELPALPALWCVRASRVEACGPAAEFGPWQSRHSAVAGLRSWNRSLAASLQRHKLSGTDFISKATKGSPPKKSEITPAPMANQPQVLVCGIFHYK